jgi:hypothetical protein
MRPEPVSEISVAQASSNSWTCSAHSTLRHGSRRARLINDCRVELIGLTDVGQKLLALDEHRAESRLAVRVDPRASTTMSSCLKAATGLCSARSDDNARQGWEQLVELVALVRESTQSLTVEQQGERYNALTCGFEPDVGFEPTTFRLRDGCSASIWTATDGSSLLTLDGPSV